MPWSKRFLALLVLGGLLLGISGCGQTPVPSIQPEASEPSAWGITAPPEPSLMQSVVSAAEPEASTEEQSEMSVPESSAEESEEPLEPQETPITESAEEPETMDTAEPPEEIEEGMLPSAVIRQAVVDYGLDSDSASAKALESINTVYTDALTEEQKNGVLVFFFEGAGDNSDPMLREDALCVVVRQGEILYLNRASTTISDYPFTEEDRVGFVWPVFSCVAPETMVRFACAICPNGAYTFSICNYSNFSDHASAFFSRDALHMDSTWGLIMPDNTSVFGSQYDTEETTLARLATAEQRLEPIIHQIKARKVSVFEEENQGPGNGSFSLTLPPFYYQYRSFTAPFYVEEDKCVGCGLCAKRCPVQAIEMRDKKPVWVKERCEKCSACINCCPKEAIEFGEWSKGVYRYTFGKYYKKAH